mgnify:CR=1 FL=1
MNRALRSTLFAVALFLILGLACTVAGGQPSPAFAAGRAETAGPAAINATVPLTGAVYLPYVIGGSATSGLSVDVRNKAAVLAFYQNYHATAPAASSGMRFSARHATVCRASAARRALRTPAFCCAALRALVSCA